MDRPRHLHGLPFAKKADGSFEHQPSLPKLKVANTCLRSDCHGKGTKDNWSEGQALYTIEAIQQEYRVRTQKMEMDAYVSRDCLLTPRRARSSFRKGDADAQRRV